MPQGVLAPLAPRELAGRPSVPTSSCRLGGRRGTGFRAWGRRHRKTLASLRVARGSREAAAAVGGVQRSGQKRARQARKGVTSLGRPCGRTVDQRQQQARPSHLVVIIDVLQSTAGQRRRQSAEAQRATNERAAAAAAGRRPAREGSGRLGALQLPAPTSPAGDFGGSEAPGPTQSCHGALSRWSAGCGAPIGSSGSPRWSWASASCPAALCCRLAGQVALTGSLWPARALISLAV